MADNDFRSLVYSFLLIGLFIVLITTFIVGMADQYNISAEKLEQATQGSLDVGGLNSSLYNSSGNAETFRVRFEEGEVENVDNPSGIFKVAGDIIGVATSPFNAMARVGQNLLGIPLVVVNVILAMVSMGMLLGIWSLIRGGR